MYGSSLTLKPPGISGTKKPALLPHTVIPAAHHDIALQSPFPTLLSRISDPIAHQKFPNHSKSPTEEAVIPLEIRKLMDPRYFELFPIDVPLMRTTGGRAPGYYETFDQASDDGSEVAAST